MDRPRLFGVVACRGGRWSAELGSQARGLHQLSERPSGATEADADSWRFVDQ